jgi:hypothetical protein
MMDDVLVEGQWLGPHEVFPNEFWLRHSANPVQLFTNISQEINSN